MLSPRTSRGQKENWSPNVCLSQTCKIWVKVTKTIAKCSTKVKSHPAACCLRSLAKTITIGSPERESHSHPARALVQCQQAIPAPATLPAGSRLGTEKRAPWQSAMGTHEEGRGKKIPFRADRGFTADGQHELRLGQTTVLAPAVNARGQGLLFRWLAQCLTHGVASARWRATREGGEKHCHTASFQ